MCIYPFREVDEGAAGGLQCDGTPEGRSGESELPEGRIELDLLLGKGFNLLGEALEGGLEFVPELTLGLLGGEVVTVVHVLVLAEVGCDFSHLGVELHVYVLLLAEHDGVLKQSQRKGYFTTRGSCHRRQSVTAN